MAFAGEAGQTGFIAGLCLMRRYAPKIVVTLRCTLCQRTRSGVRSQRLCISRHVAALLAAGQVAVRRVQCAILSAHRISAFAHATHPKGSE